jgi:hypothetical protein
MTHSIFNHRDNSEITIEDISDFVTINIYSKETGLSCTQYLTKKELRDFIGILLHVQSKMRK